MCVSGERQSMPSASSTPVSRPLTTSLMVRHDTRRRPGGGASAWGGASLKSIMRCLPAPCRSRVTRARKTCAYKERIAQVSLSSSSAALTPISIHVDGGEALRSRKHAKPVTQGGSSGAERGRASSSGLFTQAGLSCSIVPRLSIEDDQSALGAGDRGVEPLRALLSAAAPFVVDDNDVLPLAALGLMAGNRPAERGLDQAPLDLPVAVVAFGVELLMVEKVSAIDRQLVRLAAAVRAADELAFLRRDHGAEALIVSALDAVELNEHA